MNLIANIKDDELYAKALEEQIPFFKFEGWIASTVNKEVMTLLFKNKSDRKDSDPKKKVSSEETKEGKGTK